MPDNPTLRAIHALLDMVVAHDDDGTDGENLRAVQTAFTRLNDEQIVTATFDTDSGVLDLEMTALLTATGVIIDTVLRQLALRMDQDKLAVLNTVRSHLDGVFRES